MNDDELRRAFHAIADGELPPDFPDRVFARLSERRSGRPRWSIAVVAAATVAAVLLLAVIVTRPSGLSDEPTPPATASSKAEPTPASATDVTLTVEMTPGGARPPDDSTPNEVVFALQGNRAVYRDYDWGRSRSEERVAYLTPQQVDALVAFAIGPGGMADAEAEYPRNSRGPSGQTIITLTSPGLTKTVTYGLAAGNLTRDEDPTLGGLPELMERLGHFSSEVQRGNASGGMLHTDVEASIRAAFADERLTDLLAQGGHTIERVVPAERDGEALVFIATGPEQGWPQEMVVCESGQTTGEMTGIVWLVDFDQERVVAVSPRWGSFDCIGS